MKNDTDNNIVNLNSEDLSFPLLIALVRVKRHSHIQLPL